LKRILFLLPVLALLAGCTRQLDTGLSEQEAQEMVVILRQNGISAYAEVESSSKGESPPTWQVRIPGNNDQLAAAWNVLHANGLPREKAPGLSQVFSNVGLIPTAGEEKARLLVGLAGELTQTLRSLPGVVDARVHVVIPDNSPLLDKKDQSPPTASVLVRYRGDHPPLKEEEIRAFVAKGVEGLSSDNVSVIQMREEDKPLPPIRLGPLATNEWITMAALALSGITGFSALALMVVSKLRGLKIQRLERMLAQFAEGQRAIPAEKKLYRL
jgi:type III secretion protein J